MASFFDNFNKVIGTVTDSTIKVGNAYRSWKPPVAPNYKAYGQLPYNSPALLETGITQKAKASDIEHIQAKNPNDNSILIGAGIIGGAIVLGLITYAVID